MGIQDYIEFHLVYNTCFTVFRSQLLWIIPQKHIHSTISLYKLKSEETTLNTLNTTTWHCTLYTQVKDRTGEK